MALAPLLLLTGRHVRTWPEVRRIPAGCAGWEGTGPALTSQGPRCKTKKRLAGLPYHRAGSLLQTAERRCHRAGRRPLPSALHARMPYCVRMPIFFAPFFNLLTIGK
jgi:hypothetical protein